MFPRVGQSTRDSPCSHCQESHKQSELHICYIHAEGLGLFHAGPPAVSPVSMGFHRLRSTVSVVSSVMIRQSFLGITYSRLRLLPITAANLYFCKLLAHGCVHWLMPVAEIPWPAKPKISHYQKELIQISGTL